MGIKKITKMVIYFFVNLALCTSSGYASSTYKVIQEACSGSCIIRICGTIADKSDWLHKSPSSLDQYRSIILLINSTGGSRKPASELIQYLEKNKANGIPIIAYVYGDALSYGYAIASYADKIIVDSNAAIGSIGAWVKIRPQKGVLACLPAIKEKSMYNKVFIRLGVYKMQLHEDVVDIKTLRQSLIQTLFTNIKLFKTISFLNIFSAVNEISTRYDYFINLVYVNRLQAGCKLPGNRFLWAEGRIFGKSTYKLNSETDTLKKALKYGLIDRIIQPGGKYLDVIKEELEKLHEAKKKLATFGEKNKDLITEMDVVS